MVPVFASIGSILTLITLFSSTFCIVLDVTNRESIVNATTLLAHGVQELYNGNQTGGTPGKWPYPPYYWWESGGAWGGMMHYWAATKDASYSDVMMKALTYQLGPKYDFVRAEEAFDTGNDDQAFWVFAAMSAAEYGFPAPPAPAPDWHIVAQNAFNDYVYRWNTTNCGGGLKWQFYPANAGYYYKNSISNGAFFQIAARLARFTGNQTYVDWAEKVWDWVEDIGLMSSSYDIYDGTDEKINCSAVDHHQWTYNVGTFLYGTATLANYTNNSQIWVERTVGLLAATDTFFSPYTNATDIMFEAACELDASCNVDQWSMKAYLARWMANAAIVAPYIADRVKTRLQASAQGAAAACTSGTFGNTCGSKWYINKFDNITGLGQQLSALEIVTGLLFNDTLAPRHLPQVTISTVPLTALPTTVAAISDPTSTADPLHDPPPNGVSKVDTAKYGGLLMGLAHVLL